MHRSEFHVMAADLNSLMAKLGFTSQSFGKHGPGGQKSMQVVRAVLFASKGLAHATTLVIGRMVPGLPAEHPVLTMSGFDRLKATEKRALWSVKTPLSTRVQSLLVQCNELIDDLVTQPEQLRAAMMNPLSTVQWNPQTCQLVAGLLGLPNGSTVPSSWQAWCDFVHNDPIVTGKLRQFALALQAKFGRLDLNTIEYLVQATQWELYVSGINAAHTRAGAQRNDARAEIFTNGAWNIMQHIAMSSLLPWKTLDEWQMPTVCNLQDSEEVEWQACIASLPAMLRFIVEEKVAGRSNQEIAEVLDIDPERVQDWAEFAAVLLGLSKPDDDCQWT